MTEYLTIAEIEKQTGISNSNLRRYIKNFDSFFVAKGGSRVKKYEAAAVEVFQRIKSLYDEGMDTNEIHSILISEFPLVMNGEEQEENTHTAAVPTLATSDEVVKIGEAIAEIQQALAEQKQINQALLQSHQALLEEKKQDRLYFEKKFEELKYDREFVYSLRESMKKQQIEPPKEEAVTNGEEQSTVVTSGEEVTNGDEELTVTSGEEVAASHEEQQPKGKKSWLSRLFGK